MRLARNSSLCLEQRSSLEKALVMHLSEGSMQGGPAPSRATPPRRFGPRDLARFMRARLPGTARRNVSLFLGSVAGTVVFVAVCTLVNEDLVHLLAFASIMRIGASFGALTIKIGRASCRERG